MRCDVKREHQDHVNFSRLDSLEGQVHNMNQKLDEISSFLFRLPGMTSSPRPNGSSHGRADSERGHGQRHGHDLHSLAMRASGRESAGEWDWIR